MRFPGHENTKIVDGVPEGWKKERLVDIAEIQYGYAFDGTLFNADKNGTPIIRIRNIPQAETMDYTTEHVSENYLVQNGEIIIGIGIGLLLGIIIYKILKENKRKAEKEEERDFSSSEEYQKIFEEVANEEKLYKHMKNYYTALFVKFQCSPMTIIRKPK